MATPTVTKPDRVTGLPPGVSVGPLGRRLVAHLIDAVVPAVLALIVSRAQARGDGASTTSVVGVLLILVWSLLVWWMFATRAAGPGMRLMKLQLVGFTDGRPIGWSRFLLRALVLALLGVSVLGLLLMLVFLLRHPRHQGWHDLAVGSVVIAERPLAPRSQPVVPAAAVVPAAPPAPVVQPEAALVAPTAPPVAAEPLAARTPPREVAAAPVHSSGWVAVLDDGREVPVRGLVLLGRNPRPAAGEEGAELVKLADESRTVSKSHLALGVDAQGLFAVDRASTNGSTVTTADGRVTRCVPGEVVRVDEGSVVSMGDHWLRLRRG